MVRSRRRDRPAWGRAGGGRSRVRQGPIDQGQEDDQRGRIGIGGASGQNSADVLNGDPDHGEHHDRQDQCGLGELGGEEDAGGHDEADDGQQDGRRRAVVEKEGLAGPIDMGEPARLAAVHSGHQIVQGLRRATRTDDRQQRQDAHTTTQMILAALTPTLRAATNGWSEPSFGQSRTASRA